LEKSNTPQHPAGKIKWSSFKRQKMIMRREKPATSLQSVSRAISVR
jgi:hypothetical protein